MGWWVTNGVCRDMGVSGGRVGRWACELCTTTALWCNQRTCQLLVPLWQPLGPGDPEPLPCCKATARLANSQTTARLADSQTTARLAPSPLPCCKQTARLADSQTTALALLQTNCQAGQQLGDCQAGALT